MFSINSAMIFPFLLSFYILPSSGRAILALKSPVRIISHCCFILITWVVSLANMSFISSAGACSCFP